MGRLFNTTSAAIKKQINNSDAGYDMLSHWLNANKNNPNKLSLREIEAQANVNVRASAEPVSCKITYLPLSFSPN